MAAAVTATDSIGGVGAGREVDDGGHLDPGVRQPLGAAADEAWPHAHGRHPRRSGAVAERVGGLVRRLRIEIGEIEQPDRQPRQLDVLHGDGPYPCFSIDISGHGWPPIFQRTRCRQRQNFFGRIPATGDR